MTHTLKVGENYLTRNGLEARIYAIDGPYNRPIHGAIFIAGEWTPWTWYSDGTHSCLMSRGHDLLPSTHYVWVALYMVGGEMFSHPFDTEERAEQLCDACGHTRIAVLGPIDVESAP